jgi:hypothetical protein
MSSGTPRFCTQCGASLAADVKFCAQCGSAVVPQTMEARQEAERQEPSGTAPNVPDGDRGGGSGCTGCLAGLALSVVALGIPLLVQRFLSPNRSPNGAFLIVALGVMAFWGLTGHGWAGGRLVTARPRGIERGQSPVGFYIGLSMYALVGLGLYLFYLATVFSL